MMRFLLLASLMTALALYGCSRKSETHDPDQAAEPAEKTEVIEESKDTGTGAADDTSVPGDSASSSADETDTRSDNPNSEGQLICNAEWFAWVNGEVMRTQSEAITEQYPSGLPEVGSAEWFTAMDKLTGGDGAHGPDGGSDEWCFMMQQRLGNQD
ncbi:hypothetical protein JF535_14615 [Microbulbifer salipaludis]|uniref:Uncharacterized protein n=1 Tax=Microbulbifer salipaludis TaxID=187980 RepID=A0ABS3E9V0_9GAMM|nr:hypothetical protein [Microbulbifer salipaludis]MBN8432083.1 hypothetical protein [Microbulbifer salipaludis]